MWWKPILLAYLTKAAIRRYQFNYTEVQMRFCFSLKGKHVQMKHCNGMCHVSQTKRVQSVLLLIAVLVAFSLPVEMTAMKFCIGIRGPSTMNPTGNDDAKTFL